MGREKSSYTVQCVEKAMDLLEVLTQESDDVTVSGLAVRLKLSRNKAFRLLATLESHGYVEREGSSGCYLLGLSSVELAQKMLQSVSLIKHARPIMEKLARKHDEAVYVTVLKGDDVLFLDMVDSEQQIKAAPLTGKRYPFFTNAAGKVIRAFESRDLLDKFKKRHRKEDLPDFAELELELNTIRSRGVAIETNGLGEGIITVAVAVKDYAGTVICALTMIGPSFRMLADRVENEIVPSLVDGAEALSRRFGYAKM